MDFKVLITNSGEESLFTTLSTELERRLPKAAVEWKRSYGRPPKSVILQASFCKFDSNRLSSSLDPNLQTKPLLHIFWTSCLDNDYFKSTVRNSILKWQKELIQHRCSDWLIIHVVKQENVRSGKSKIQLPRSSVYDKIKLEFCQKLQERCLQLWEPDKSTLFTKSGESWDMLLVQLRRLLINSFGNYLDLFEEKIRVAREKYADPDWSFIEYFIAHEELALIYQSITLKEDALVQYDEVDALLSQFVINCKGKEPPNWLQALCFTPTSWDGVTLSSTVCTHYRDLIKSGKASLLDFRNYLFSRQCKLLIKMKRSWDIPLRLTDFLFAMIHELGFLKISMDSGMISCWIILTCMQLFQVLEATENKDRVFSTCMANLYYYLFSKLYVIGQLTGLYYYRKQTEVEIVNVNNLLTGIGKHHVSKKDTYSFSKSLKSALQSQSKFGELFIQIASKSMESFKELNYKHFTVRVGVQLANYYLEHEQYLDADSLLQEAQNIYKNQKWEVLHNDILIPLAHCQSKLKSYKQYLKSVCVLACSPYLSLSKKLHYNEELIRLMSENNLGCISTEPLIKIKKIRIPLVKGKGHIGDCVSVHVQVDFELKESFFCQKAVVYFKYFDTNTSQANIISTDLFQQINKFETVNSKIKTPLTKQISSDISARTSFTQNTLVKRIKEHRRTWSRNKNIPDLNDTDGPAVSKVLSSSVKSSSESLENIKRSGSSLERTNSFVYNKLPEEQFVTENLTSSRESISKSASNGSIFTYDEVLDASDLTTKSSAIQDKQHTITDVSNSGKSSIDLSVTSKDSNSSLNVLQNENEKNQEIKINDFILTFGTNDLVFSTKINFEGRFILSHIEFYVSNAVFTHKLKLPNEHSFSMVIEPPKIEWTSNYIVDSLLTGSKERLYVTMLNGPGIVIENSVLNIFSNSGLVFYGMNETDACIYPLENNQLPRHAVISVTTNENKEAALILPHCLPYERINICFDVVAPLENDGKTNIQHEIMFVCSWLKDLTMPIVPMRLECIFYEPFQIKYDTISCGDCFLVKITLCGVNPVELKFLEPMILGQNQDKFYLLDTAKDITLFGSEEYTLIWKYESLENSEVCTIDCTFKVNFKQSKDDMQSLTVYNVYSKELKLKFSKYSYSLQVIMDDCELVNTAPFKVEVIITKREADSLDKLYLMHDPSDTVWKSNKNIHPIFFENSLQTKLYIELSTEQSGLVPWPRFLLSKVYSMEVEGDGISFEMITGFQRHEIFTDSMARVLFIRSV
ncbi:uncharacterized protein LOC100207710 isoform X1 [Hydra vulgaris]|uniref:uncharacterized protein LOC100207710 isoform X1 n=2 Tax=Hydra vulgaris TaxID=6087 RepID=UPI001F5FCCDF|nr:uncharacterized protein LOC100207710 [Hydra vulgaris]